MKLIHRNTFVLLGQGDGVEKVGKEAGLLYSTTGSLQERQHVFFTPPPWPRRTKVLLRWISFTSGRTACS